MDAITNHRQRLNLDTILANHQWTSDDVRLIENLAVLEARESFWAYRRWIHPTMLKSWYQMQVALALQLFYEQLLANKKPVLILEAPPQHGKSSQMIDFLSWLAGQDPNIKMMYGSYSDDLGVRANTTLQRIFDSQRYKDVFPKTLINDRNVVTQSGRYQRNSTLLEFVGKEGYFRNTTVLGQINGFGLDVGLIDDPIKGRKEANSKTIRDGTWNWLIDDFYGRFSEMAGLIIIMTRWHVDDPVGRFIPYFPDATVLRYPALAEQDEEFRRKGEPLFPEHKSLDFLLKRKRVMTTASWESLYQQNPIIVGGGLFPIEKFEIIPQLPTREVVSTVRYWDKAGTKNAGAFTCGTKMHRMKDGRFVISHVRRGQWSAWDRERIIKQTAEIDNKVDPIDTWIEQEPGSGGKESAERTIANLAGFVIFKDKVTGSKEIRADPYAAQVQAGNVALVAGSWNDDFIDEHEPFPNGKYKDQVDSAAGAFAKLADEDAEYDATLSWVR